MRRILLLLLAFSLVVRAEDWKTTDGTVYEKVKVLSHDTAYVTILYSDGGAKVPLRLLTPDLQARFGYDATKAAAAETAATTQDHSQRAAVTANQQAALVQQATPPPQPVQPLVQPAGGANFNGGLLTNGNFARGDSNWLGDGQTPRVYAQTHRAGPITPDFNQGLIVMLNPTAWTKIYQSFSGDKTGSIAIDVTYRISKDLAPSKNRDDYQAINKKLGLDGFERYGSMAGSVGDFYGTVGDPTATSMAMEVYHPTLGSTEVQPYQHNYPTIPKGGDKTFVLAFPPGSGTVDILTVRVFNP